MQKQTRGLRSTRGLKLVAAFALLAGGLSAAEGPAGGRLNLRARSRVELKDRPGQFQVVEKAAAWDPKETAFIVCDMWDLHHCLNAVRREKEMAPRMEQVLRAARDRGVLIIHAPSSCMDAYKDHPARKRAVETPKARNLPTDIGQWCNRIPSEEKGQYPIDQSDGGEDDDPAEHRDWAAKLTAMGRNPKAPWKSEIDVLTIDPARDIISDNGEEIWSVLEERKIKNVALMGVHLNMCVLGRPFGLRQMAKNGKNVVLMRDLTDTMYNPERAPKVNHFSGTDLMIEHVEKFVCPSISSEQIIGGEPFSYSTDQRRHIAFLIAEDEYKTEQTLPVFAARQLDKNDHVSYILDAEGEKNNLPGVSALGDADVLVVSARRRVLPKEQLDAIRKFVASGKGVVGIRTASHAFCLRGNAPIPAGHDAWTGFDPEVLGGQYTNHHGEGSKVSIALAPKASAHPILEGVDVAGLVGNGSLYKVSPIAKTATPLLIGSIPNQPAEPVAWVNAPASGNRVFYTSLGHPDDFSLPAFQRLLKNAIDWAAAEPAPVKTTRAKAPRSGGPLSPADSYAKLKPGPGLAIDLVLSEPEIAQPVFLNFDERGRMWVVEYRQYPEPAGLTMLSRDKFWRAAYDKVPEPPPHHVRGKDRISIHEDTDGNGAFDKHTVFVDGLNIATACARGRGGVWVLNPPYLLFYPDLDNNDVPDGDPVVHLKGFGLEDTHSVTNSLRWGPDGWLYAAQGSTVSADIIRPGIDKTPVHSMGQLIWRYHPETHRYEIFAEGGGNAFGVEIDAKARIFSGHNGGDTRGFHYVQGGYSQKGFEKHGPLSNPYAFGYFPAMKHPQVPRFTHTFLIYGDDALPEQYRGKLFGVAPLLSHVVVSEIKPLGSTFETRDVGYAATSSDPWFRPVDIKEGPEGALYVADWYDGQVNHYRNHEGQIDRTNGRIYRIRSADAKPTRTADLARKSTDELLVVLSTGNTWARQTALRLLGDRKDPGTIPTLRRMIREGTGQPALEALWALHLAGGLDEATALATLDHPDPYVRLWTVRLLGDENRVSPSIESKLVERAQVETDVEARNQLACTARRLSAGQGLPIVARLLAHKEDATDPQIPLLLWWAIEARCENDRDAVLALFQDAGFWNQPVVEKHILARLMRRFAASGSRKDLLTCAKLLELAPGQTQSRQLMLGFEQAFKGRPLAGLPDELAAALAKSGGGSLLLDVRRGRAEAIDEALRIVGDEKADRQQRLACVEVFGEVKQPRSVALLLAIVERSRDDELRSAALTALLPYDDPKIAAAVIARYRDLPDAVRDTALTLLASRKASTLAFLEAVDRKQVDPATVSQEAVRRLAVHHDDRIASMVARHWGAVEGAASSELQRQVDRFVRIAQSGSGDRAKGRALFSASCAKCHTLFGQGGKVGPDLTAYQRQDVATMLLSIVNPSAEIREGFETIQAATNDGRVVSGLLVEKDPRVLILRGADGQTITLRRDEIDEVQPQRQSLMPEGLLKGLNEQQVRDLFAYLRSTQPLIE